ncbi:hypothetical protein KSS87_002730 [Heliosperma pusillum]|nr:hypothetical protein KSS87_002730 [Heliosperma pusillum]
MGSVDFSTRARNRLAVLATHLSSSDESITFPQIVGRKCLSSQSLVEPPSNLKGSLTIIDERTGKKYQFPVSEEGTVKATDFKKITTGKNDKGLKLFDPGYLNTAPVRSKICYIDGDEGILRYRGYPIEELAESSSFLEVAYLLMYGNLPSKGQLADWEFAVSQHSAVPQGILNIIQSMPHDAHPMGVLVSAMSTLSIFHPDANPALRLSQYEIRRYKFGEPDVKISTSHLYYFTSQVYYKKMSTKQDTSPSASKKTYATILQGTPSAATSQTTQSESICTRGMTRKAVFKDATASLRSARVVPTRPRNISVASIVAAAKAIINASSPSRKEYEVTKRDKTSPCELRASPKKIEASTPISASVMTISGSTVEEQIENMSKILERMMKDNEEKNKKIDDLHKELAELREKKIQSEHVNTDKDDDDDDHEKEDEKKDGGKPSNNDICGFTEKQLQDFNKEYQNAEKDIKTSSKDVMAVSGSNTTMKISRYPTVGNKKNAFIKDFKGERPLLKELQAKKYPFGDSDLSNILDDLLEKNVIQLPESKRPEQANKTTDPNYCRYHRLVSHPLEKCITLKEKIMQLAREGQIILDLDETVAANHASVVLEHPKAPSILVHEVLNNFSNDNEWCVNTIQFGSFKPLTIWRKKELPSTTEASSSVIQPTNKNKVADDNKNLESITSKKPWGQAKLQTRPTQQQRKQGKKIMSEHLKDNVNQVTVNTISVMTNEERREENNVPLPTTLTIFDRIRQLKIRPRYSAFNRLERSKAIKERHLPLNNRQSVFKRLGLHGRRTVTLVIPSHPNEETLMLQPLISPTNRVLKRLGVSIKTHRSKHQHIASANQEIKEVEDSIDVKSLIPSSMKRMEILAIIQVEPLKVKRQVVVLMNQQKPSKLYKGENNEEIVALFHAKSKASNVEHSTK